MSTIRTLWTSDRLVYLFLWPMRVFMAVAGHKPDLSTTPVQNFELAQRAQAHANLLQLSRDQEADYIVESAEAHVRKLDDEIAGRKTLTRSFSRH